MESKIKCLRLITFFFFGKFNLAKKFYRFATEAAISILRIDDMIKLEPEKEDLPQRR